MSYLMHVRDSFQKTESMEKKIEMWHKQLNYSFKILY